MNTKTHAVEHIQGVELVIVSDKLITHTESELRNLHTHKLELSFEAAEVLYIKLGQQISIAKELVDENMAIITERQEKS
ncbi:hypothetical protein [Vibrio harveyi]|uniref:hypothetical protein n=1 Tax=Vibrio harveyi TaxID=669 RepID=UPI00209B8FD0|nr:hypothetical protein [Vibrio harveyi]